MGNQSERRNDPIAEALRKNWFFGKIHTLPLT
jgi:hypothetical protein